jgi:hypothetical protein
MTLAGRARLRAPGSAAQYLARLLTAQAGRDGASLELAVTELRELAALFAGTADMLAPATRETTRYTRQATPDGAPLS